MKTNPVNVRWDLFPFSFRLVAREWYEARLRAELLEKLLVDDDRALSWADAYRLAKLLHSAPKQGEA